MFFIEQLKYVLIGIIIGGGMILPGVSGGVLAVILGVYEKILDSVGGFLKDIKKNTLFLAPLVLGMIIGLIILGKILFFVFAEYPAEAKYTFIGLILGGIPALYRELEKKGSKKLNVLAFVISLAFSLILFVFGRNVINIDFSNKINGGVVSFLLLFISGFIYVAGKIVPGISSSFMLMLIGMYTFLLNILQNPFGLSSEEYIQIIPFILGVLMGAVVLVKFIRYLFKNHASTVYSIIIGFVIGSISAIYPGFSFDLQGLICLSLFALSLFASYRFSLINPQD